MSTKKNTTANTTTTTTTARVIAYTKVTGATKLDVAKYAGKPFDGLQLKYKNACGYLALLAARAASPKASDDAVRVAATTIVNLTGVYFGGKGGEVIAGVSANGKYKVNKKYMEAKHMHAARLGMTTSGATDKTYKSSRACVYLALDNSEYVANYVAAFNAHNVKCEGKVAKLTAKALVEAGTKWRKAHSKCD